MKKLSTERISKSILMKIRPLWLREKIFYMLFVLFGESIHKYLSCSTSISLIFAPGVIMKLSSTDIEHKAISFCGFCELNVSLLIAAFAKNKGILVDVGANYGYYSCLWAGLNPDNHVFAFEASPRNIAFLRENISQNHFQSRI